MSQKLDLGARGEFACLLFDSTFKIVICNPENEDLLIGIIELLLPGKHIQNITFVNKERHGLVISEKNVTFDMLCKDKDTGEEFLVEVQNAPQDSYRDRMLSYATYPIREQLELKVKKLQETDEVNRMDYSLKPVYVLSFINFKLKHETLDAIEDGYVSRYELRNRHNAELMTPALNFVFVEMGRMELKSSDKEKCKTLLERFVFSLKYMHTFTTEPDGFQDELLKKLFHASRVANMTVTERENYQKAMRTEIDRYAELAYAHKEGHEEGHKQGLQEGRILTAKAMLADGIPAEKIMAYTGLTAEELESL